MFVLSFEDFYGKSLEGVYLLNKSFLNKAFSQMLQTAHELITLHKNRRVLQSITSL
jgi:hypothetical protein